MTKYTGSCHCGNVAYEVEADLSQTIVCNCSICTKRGSILAFAPETAFTLLKGEDAQTDYLFNRKIIHHLFCKTCGILSFGRGVAPDGTKTVAINVRCLDGVDLDALTPHHYDGRSV